MKTTVHDLKELLDYLIYDNKEIVIVTTDSNGIQDVLKFGHVAYNEQKQRYEIEGN